MTASRGVARKLLETLYWWVCVGLWAVYLYFTLVARFGNADAAANAVRTTDSFVQGIKDLWPPTSDPVLNFFIGVAVAIIVAIFIPGLFTVAIYIVIGCFASVILVTFVTFLLALGQVSVTGAIVAGILGVLPLVLLIRRYRAPIGRRLRPVGDALFGLFLDWWLYPLLFGLKEKKIMNRTAHLKLKLDQSIERLHSDPEIADLSLSLGYDTWIAQVAERFRDRQRQKSVAEKIKLLSQVKQFYVEYRAALDAQDELHRAHSAYGEKDEEAELRGLERKKRRMVLEHEMEDLEAKHVKAKAPAPQQKSTKDRIAAAFEKVKTLADVERQKQAVQAQYQPGSPECEYAQSVADHLSELIKEGRW